MRERHWVLHTGTVYRVKVDTEDRKLHKASHTTHRLLIANRRYMLTLTYEGNMNTYP